MNVIFGLQSWPSKVQIMLAALFPKIVQKHARNDEFYAKNYASTIYQLLVPAGIFSRVRKLSAAQMLRDLKPLVTLRPRLMILKYHYGSRKTVSKHLNESQNNNETFKH